MTAYDARNYNIGVSRPQAWDTMAGRIAYMMDRRGIDSLAELGRRAGISERQMANTQRRLAQGKTVYLDTMKKIKEALEVEWDWLVDNIGYPNDAIRLLIEGVSHPKSSPPPPPPEKKKHDSGEHVAPAHRGSGRPPGRPSSGR